MVNAATNKINNINKDKFVLTFHLHGHKFCLWNV